MYYFFCFFLYQGTSYRRSCRRNFEKGSFDWKLEQLVPLLIVESDWKAANNPSTPTISPNTSNQNFKIAILFRVTDFQRENMFFEEVTPPQPLGQGFCSYALEVYKNDVGTMYYLLFFPLDQGISYRRSCRNFEKGSFNQRLEWLVPFVIVENDWKATNTPSTPTISRNTYNQNIDQNPKTKRWYVPFCRFNLNAKKFNF